MNVHAIFKGTKGLGYKPKQDYVLRMEFVANKIIIYRKVDHGGACVYESLKAFLNNWDLI